MTNLPTGTVTFLFLARNSTSSRPAKLVDRTLLIERLNERGRVSAGDTPDVTEPLTYDNL